jgi:hypothetical protein
VYVVFCLLDDGATLFAPVQVPTSCPGVPSTLLQPHLQWTHTADYSAALEHLAQLFADNFRSLIDSSLSSSCDSRSRQLARSGFTQKVAKGGPTHPPAAGTPAAAATEVAAAESTEANGGEANDDMTADTVAAPGTPARLGTARLAEPGPGPNASAPAAAAAHAASPQLLLPMGACTR